jgi:hypothetical protein
MLNVLIRGHSVVGALVSCWSIVALWLDLLPILLVFSAGVSVDWINPPLVFLDENLSRMATV